MSFWGELKRRNVVKVGAAYAVVSWLLIQAASILFPTFGAPAWVMPVFSAVIILGFPLVLIVAWAYEITPEGIKKTSQVSSEESITHVTGQKLNYVVTTLLAVAVVLLVVDNYVLEDSSEQAAEQQAPEPAATIAPAVEAANDVPLPVAQEGEPPVLPNSIAVIPFSNLSPRDDDAYFAAGIHEEILNQLVKLSSLNVIARTSVLRYAGTQKAIPEIARELNVETVMEGSVRFADGRVLVTTQLVDAATNLHLWSESYERDFANIFAIQADIAMNVANALEAEFTEAEQESIERLPTDSLEAYELYLTAREQLYTGSLAGALESIDAALALDPDFARAWATKADLHGLRGQQVPADQYAAEQDAMFRAAARAAEIEPDLVEAQALLAAARGRRGEWIEAEAAFRRAYAASNSGAAPRYVIHLFSVGNIDKAYELGSTVRRTDPFNQTLRGFYLLALALRGDAEAADREYDRGTAVFGGAWLGNWFVSMARLQARGASRPEEIPFFQPVHNAAREHLGSPDAGLAALREAFGRDNLAIGDLLAIAVWSGHFGDSELALKALEEATRRNAQNVVNAWIPSMHEVRQLPRFKEFMREIGLVGYWREFGWPNLCRPLGADDFECS